MDYHYCYHLTFKSLITTVILTLAVAINATGGVTVGDLTYLVELSPGETYHDYLEVKNTGQSVERVRIYLTDYTFTNDGTARYPKAGSLPRSNAGWIELEVGPEPVEILGGETVRIPYTIRVPEDEALTGTYWSMVNVIVQPSSSRQETSVFHVKQTYGYGIQTITNIGKSGSRDVKILGLDRGERDGASFLEVTVRNTGERMLEPVVTLELYDHSGQLRSSGENRGGKKLIYPGSSTNFEVPIDDLAPGPYEGLLIVNNLDQYVWGAGTTIEIPSN